MALVVGVFGGSSGSLTTLPFLDARSTLCFGASVPDPGLLSPLRSQWLPLLTGRRRPGHDAEVECGFSSGACALGGFEPAIGRDAGG